MEYSVNLMVWSYKQVKAEALPNVREYFFTYPFSCCSGEKEYRYEVVEFYDEDIFNSEEEWRAIAEGWAMPQMPSF